MKKILLSLIAVMATLSINAQVVEVYDLKKSTTEPIATYTNNIGHSYKIVFKEAAPAGDSNLLPNGFSVSDTKQVQFTKGNLYYSSTDSKYHFEATQNSEYHIISPTEYDPTYVGDFYWSNATDYQTSGMEPWAASYSYSTQSTSDKFFCGENNKMTVDGTEGLYALTKAEWQYLLNTRRNADDLYKYNVSVTIDDKTVSSCLIIAPDNYDGDIASSYTADEWAIAEADGLVCLPTIGNEGIGEYWTSTASSANNAYCFKIRTFDVGMEDNLRSKRRAIRLVKTLSEQNAGETTGETTGEANVSESAGIEGNKVQWVQLWENGPKWAVFNVGAKSASEYGGYYTWGGSISKDPEAATISTGVDIQGSTNDTAKKIWGDNWQMPTESDLNGLLNKCDVTWTTQNGLSGRLYTGKGDYSSNSVFFPAAGRCSKGTESGQGEIGYYWSSTPMVTESNYLEFQENSQSVNALGHSAEFSVRAIMK